MRGQDSRFETFTYQYLDLLKGPVKDLIKMSSDDFLIRRVCVAAIPAPSQLEGGNRFDAEIQVVTYRRQPGQEFLPAAIKRFKKAVEPQLSPFFSRVTVKFNYEPFLFPSAQDIETLQEFLNKNIQEQPPTIVEDTYHHLIELISDPKYTSDFDHYRKHSADVFNALSFILWPNIYRITGDKPSNLDVCGKDDKTRIFMKSLREKLEAIHQNNLLTGIRHSIKLQDQDISLFEQPFEAHQNLSNIKLNMDAVSLILESELPTKQKMQLHELLMKMLEAIKKRFTVIINPLLIIRKYADSFYLMSVNFLALQSVFNTNDIARLCGHDLLDLRRLEVVEFYPFIKEQLKLCNELLPIFTSHFENIQALIRNNVAAIETLRVQLNKENEATAKQSTHEKKQDLPAASETLERPPVNAFTMPTTFFNPVTNYNKEVRARLREIENQSSKHSPTVTEPVRIPENNPEQVPLYMAIAIREESKFNIDMRTLSQPNGGARLIQIQSTLVNQHIYVFTHGLIELTKQEIEWLQAADGRPLLTKTGRDANGLKRSPHYHALVLKRTDYDKRLIFHYLDVKQEGQNCRVYFPVTELSHKDYGQRFYRDNTECQRFWSNLREELGQHVSIRLTTQISETPLPDRPRP